MAEFSKYFSTTANNTKKQSIKCLKGTLAWPSCHSSAIASMRRPVEFCILQNQNQNSQIKRGGIQDL